VSANSERQVAALAGAIEGQLKDQGEKPLAMEGDKGSQWVLVDYGDVVAHVFHEEARFYYDLDGMWHQARRIPVEVSADASSVAEAS